MYLCIVFNISDIWWISCQPEEYCWLAKLDTISQHFPFLFKCMYNLMIAYFMYYMQALFENELKGGVYCDKYINGTW